MVAIAGPGGSPQPIGVRDNDVFRRVLLFFSLAESNSGVYTCQVMVDGTTIRIVTAAMDVSGKLETLRGKGREEEGGREWGERGREGEGERRQVKHHNTYTIHEELYIYNNIINAATC